MADRDKTLLRDQLGAVVNLAHDWEQDIRRGIIPEGFRCLADAEFSTTEIRRALRGTP